MGVEGEGGRRAAEGKGRVLREKGKEQTLQVRVVVRVIFCS